MTNVDPFIAQASVNDPQFDPSAQSGPQSFHRTAAIDQPANFQNPQLPNPRSRPDLNRRVYQLLQQGHNWLGLQTLYGLADSGASDQDISHIADYLRQITVHGAQAAPLRQALPGARRGVAQGTSTLTSMSQYTPGVMVEGKGAIAAQQGLLGSAQDAINKADDGFKHIWDDPVLQKRPSAALAIKSYLSNTLGVSPVGGDTLTHSQQQLQLMGYGRDLDVTGTMSAGWRGAFAEYSNGVFRSQLSGNRPGAISIDHALKALQALTPSSAWPALYGFVTHLPDGARMLASDVVGSFAGLGAAGYAAATGDESAHAETHGAAASWVNNILGGDHQTPQQNVKDFQEHFGKHLLEDGLNVIMLSSIIGSAGRFAQAAGTELQASTNAELAGQLTSDAAYRGPGVVAKTFAMPGAGNLTNPMFLRGAAGAVIGGGGTALAGGNSGQILAGTLGGAALGAGSATSAFDNIPVLRRISPMVDKLADSDAAYYKIRSWLHSPYTWTAGSPDVGAVRGAIGSAARLGDTAFQQSLLLGGEAQGLGQIQQTLTGDKPGQAPFASAVMNQHSLDSVNDAIAHKLQFNLFGQAIKPNLDDLMFVFGGSGAHALKLTSSSEVGQWAQQSLRASSGALGELGIGGMIERLNDGKSLGQITKEFGGSDNLNEFWWNRIYDHAANFAATKKFNEEFKDIQTVIPSISDETRLRTIKRYETEIRRDPQLRSDALRDLLTQNGTNELYVRLLADKQLAPAEFDPANIKPLLEANNHVRTHIIPLVGQREPALVGAATDTEPALHLNQADDEKLIGVIPKDRLTQQKAHDIELELEQRYKDIATRERAGSPLNPDNPEGPIWNPELIDHPPTMEEKHQWEQDMDNHIRQMGSDPTMMPQQGMEKVNWAKNFSYNHLPIEITANSDLAQRNLDYLDGIGDGYTAVTSNDISHHVLDSGPWNEFSGSLTTRRRIAESLGLNPNEIDDRHRASIITDAQIQNIKRLQDKGVNFGPGETPQSLIEIMGMKGVFNDTSLKGKVERFFDSRRKTMNLLEEDDPLKAVEEAVPFKELKRKDFVQAMRDPRTFEYRHQGNYANFNYILDKQGNHSLIPEWMTEDAANQLYTAMQKGYNAPGFHMTGLPHIEDMFRTSLSFMGGTPILPDKLSYAIANMPNRLIQARDTWRFDLSPMFDIRRIYKTNLKMAAYGIGPTTNPIKQLMDTGEWENAKKALQEVQPDQHMAEILGWTDEAKRYLDGHSVFGWYNAEAHKAWAALDMKRQGLPTDEISHNLDDIFSYGKRTGAERSMNFLFFPFSFVKSLYKIMGSYILDKPAQRLVLTRGMAAYDQFNKNHMDGSNPLATSFWHEHLPLFDEVAKVNAFNEGISLGEPGGINRPLANIFLPQSWAPSQYNQNLLERFIPAVRDFEHIYVEGLDQAHIGENFAKNLYRDINGTPATISNPRLPVKNQYDDLSDAFAMDLRLNTFYHDNILAHTKIPVSPEWGEFSGRTMTKQLIREIVSKAHPIYKAEGAAAYVQHTNAVFDTYKATLRGTPGTDGKFHDAPKLPDGTPKFQYVSQFQQATNALAYSLANAKKPAELADRTEQLRKAATYLAQNDSEFYKLYRTTFLRVLGPLERVK